MNATLQAVRKTALLTGASSGIGLDFARLFAEAGAGARPGVNARGPRERASGRQMA
jgi:NAD(P)-dependent dehydrogenase (short-subunit alcohol dehydrogenase family)